MESLRKGDIARLYLVDVPYFADKLYDYYIPAELSAKVFEGSLVSVPFGTGNRRMNGVVRQISDVSGYDSLKPIISVSGDEPLVDSEQMALAEFLKEYTLCTVGEALRAIVPSAAFSKITEYARINPDKEYDAASGKLSERSVAILNYIGGFDKVHLSKLSVEFGEDYSKYFAPLVKGKYVIRFTDVSEGSKGKTELVATLAVSAEEALDIANGAPGALRLRSEKQAEVLRCLAASGEMSREELSAACGCTTAHISALEKKGLVTTRKETVFRNPYKNSTPIKENIVLSEEQTRAYHKLCSLYEDPSPKAALLYGVTGSGKTSVIKKMIDRARADGKGVIMLVPEIALTPQAVAVFCGYYGECVSVLHSGLSQGERFDAYRRIRDGLSDIVIGTRSAIFAPLKNIGLIIIDEEQEHTYKSDSDPKYLAHDVARYRSMVHSSMLLLASATPSFASYYKAVSGKYSLVELKERYGGATLPQVKICDMRREVSAGNASPIGMELATRLSETVEKGRQAIVFLNRRGYNSSVTCMSCGETVKCPNCSVSLTFHTGRVSVSADGSDLEKSRARSGYLICHYCGHREKVPEKCPSCKKEHFRFMGCGTQKAEEEIKKIVPDAKISRMDMDTTGTKSAHGEILEEFRSEKTNILLGTQMVAKGHDFPKVTLVGVMGADSSLYLDDYRAAERTFSMLTQVIGRAGRKGGEEGLAVVQTLNPDCSVIREAATQNYRAFYEREIRIRKNLAFPPFCDMVVLTLAASDEALLSASAVKLSERLQDMLKKEYPDIGLQAFGPFENPVYKVQNVCRMRMVLKCRVNKRLRKMLSELLLEFGKNTKKKVNLSIDINPSGL
ncbi:MAG: primosomal protein N' [Ruminococcaceae bacterium]|nr:primosomal protein N' [Oscillospiraceae bacterium]